MKHAWVMGLVAWGMLIPAVAQNTVPNTQQMIEQLKPARTRSLRNLVIEAAPSPEAAPPVAAPQASLSLSINFELNSTAISPDSREALNNLSQALQSDALSGSRFAVEGHTDAKGNASYNVKLSQQRAQAVADYLTEQGIVAARMLVVGKGSGELLNRDQPFAPENRRVRIVMLN